MFFFQRNVHPCLLADFKSHILFVGNAFLIKKTLNVNVNVLKLLPLKMCNRFSSDKFVIWLR